MNTQEAKKLEDKVLQTLKKYIQDTDTVIVGVSGGADSIFLLNILSQLPIKVIVAHINHKLRIPHCDQDEEFVKTTVDEINNSTKRAELLFYSKSANIASLSKKEKTGLEETGRKTRYDFFKKLLKSQKGKFIITAHHANDNLETIILNLARGGSLQGLTGIKTLTPPLLRPLLDISKKEITDYLKLKNISHKEDASNKDTKYKRNFVRSEIVPLFQKINPSVIETTANNVRNLREFNDFIISEAQKWIKTQNTNKLNAKEFRKLHKALQKTILREIYKEKIGNTNNLETKHIEEVLKIIDKNIGNKKKKMKKLKIEIKNNVISIEK